MAGAGQRRAQGAFFLLLAVFFAGIAAAGGAAARDGEAGLWVVAVAAGTIALWFLALVTRAFRAGRR